MRADGFAYVLGPPAPESAIREATEDEVTQAFTRLAGLNAAEVIGELFLWIEDVTEGGDLDVLIAAARIPLPKGAKKIVRAIRGRNMRALKKVAGHDDLGALVQSVLTVIVSLKDARDRP